MFEQLICKLRICIRNTSILLRKHWTNISVCMCCWQTQTSYGCMAFWGSPFLNHNFTGFQFFPLPLPSYWVWLTHKNLTVVCICSISEALCFARISFILHLYRFRVDTMKWKTTKRWKTFDFLLILIHFSWLSHLLISPTIHTYKDIFFSCHCSSSYTLFFVIFVFFFFFHFRDGKCQ